MDNSIFDTTMSDIEMLNKVNEAITAVMVLGQSYKIGSRSVTKADFDKLRSFKAELEARISSNNSGALLANTSVAVFDTR